jgi:hypothetical protein
VNIADEEVRLHISRWWLRYRWSAAGLCTRLPQINN